MALGCDIIYQWYFSLNSFLVIKNMQEYEWTYIWGKQTSWIGVWMSYFGEKLHPSTFYFHQTIWTHLHTAWLTRKIVQHMGFNLENCNFLFIFLIGKVPEIWYLSSVNHAVDIESKNFMYI